MMKKTFCKVVVPVLKSDTFLLSMIVLLVYLHTRVSAMHCARMADSVNLYVESNMKRMCSRVATLEARQKHLEEVQQQQHQQRPSQLSEPTDGDDNKRGGRETTARDRLRHEKGDDDEGGDEQDDDASDISNEIRFMFHRLNAMHNGGGGDEGDEGDDDAGEGEESDYDGDECNGKRHCIIKEEEDDEQEDGEGEQDRTEITAADEGDKQQEHEEQQQLQEPVNEGNDDTAPAAFSQEDLSKMKVVDLKALAKSYGCDTRGNKDALVHAILAATTSS